jgi:hypothetical protein
MANTELFCFLGRCLSLNERGENKEELIRKIKGNKINWKHFVSMASNHLVLPSVYLRLKTYNILAYLPEELSNHLKMIYDLNLQRNIAILKQIERINHLFAAVGIIPIYLKGAGNILDQLYETPGERMLGDIDLLVSDNEFLHAVQALKNKGYKHYYPFYEDQQKITKHFPGLVHPSEVAYIEVHRSPVDFKFSRYFNYSIIDLDKKAVKAGSSCFVLSDRHNVIMNFMHGFMNRGVKLSGSVSYRNLLDLFYLRHRIDIYKVFSKLPKYASQARIYADFMYYSMGHTNKYGMGKQSKKFIRKYKSLRRSKFRYRTNWVIKYLWFRFWSGYLFNIVGIFTNKGIRLSVSRKLRTPRWYILHFKSYFHSYKQNCR